MIALLITILIPIAVVWVSIICSQNQRDYLARHREDT